MKTRAQIAQRIGNAILLGWTFGPIVLPRCTTDRGHLRYNRPERSYEDTWDSVYIHPGPRQLENALDAAGVPRLPDD